MNKNGSVRKQLVLLLVASIFAFAGYGCDTCNESIRVSDTSGARLYYPCDISQPAAATTLTSGYLGTYSAVEWLAEDLVAAGYVVLAATPSNQYGMVNEWRSAHKACIAKLKELNSSHATLRGLIRTDALQTCGHSKGGGGSLWASSELKGEVGSTIGMAPYQEQFSDSTLQSITAATYIQAGASDSLATGSMTLGEYRALPATISRAYIRYSNTDHMSWSTGGSNQSRLSRDIIAWMKYYLDGDPSQKNYIADTSGTTMHEWVDLGSTGGDVYSFVAAHSGKALDVWEWGTTDGTNIAQYDYWQGDAQKFNVTDVGGEWYRISPVISSGQAVEVADASVESGANIQTYSYWEHACQQWRFEDAGSGQYRIVNRNSGMCLTVEDASLDDGANVIQDTCTSGAQHQMFQMIEY